MDKQIVKEGYNKSAERYSSTRAQFKSNKYLDKLVKLLKSGATILDLGCGSGKPIDSYLVSRGFKITGIDISEKQIELARRNIPQATFEVKDMSELKEGEYTVDAAVSFYAIFHTPRERHHELFNKINSFLPKGGLILVTMGAGEWEGTEENFHGVKMWWSHYGSEKNRQMIEDSGFKILLDEIDDDGQERHQVVLAEKEL